MAGKPYDDDEIIGLIDALLIQDVGLSRRAAIIKVAGEDSLRRIEMKMAKRQMASNGSIELPAAGFEWDVLAARLAVSEKVLMAGTSEHKIWSGFNSRDVIGKRKLEVEHPRFQSLRRIANGMRSVTLVMLGAFATFLPLGLFFKSARPDLHWGVQVTTFVAVTFVFTIIPFMAIGIFLAKRCEGILNKVSDATRPLIRRYVVTDKAAYLITPTGTGAAWTRTPLGSIEGTSKISEHGVQVVGSLGRVELEDLRDVDAVMQACASAA